MSDTQDPNSADSINSAKVGGCACFNVRQAARAITGLYDSVIEPVGLKITQFAILATIHRDRDDEPTMQSLAAELGLDPSTMTRTLRPLVDDGVIEIVAGSGGDRRVKTVALTSLGRHKLGQGRKRWEDAQRQLADKIGPEVFDRLIGDLRAVTQALRD